ncbi:hypothetical protein GH733_003073 [Mirounga leonina]|nr:hypothetical protein GH733_003073 [Mirounga leonina]
MTDFIAPNYSMIIKYPLDFSTKSEKIKKDDSENWRKFLVKEYRARSEYGCMANVRRIQKQKHKAIASSLGRTRDNEETDAKVFKRCSQETKLIVNMGKDCFVVIYSIYGETRLPRDLSSHEFWPHAKIIHELGTPSPKDEGQNRTIDVAKNTEVTEMDLGCSDSNSQDRLTALSAVRYRTPGDSFD